MEPGQELLLLPGDYTAGCTVRRGGRPGAPLVIRAADPERPPRLLLPRANLNLLEIRADDVTIRGLVFESLFPNADGVRIISGNRITVEECRFIRLTGIAVAANHASVRGLTVRCNVITDSNATAMYFGCHDGITCTVTRLRVEGNYIRGVMAPDPEIGYGVEVKVNSSAMIRGNTVADTKGPGIMVYGSRDLTRRSLVERNFASGSRTSSGIVGGGGPAVIRNNISVWNAKAGIALENYGPARVTARPRHCSQHRVQQWPRWHHRTRARPGRCRPAEQRGARHGPSTSLAPHSAWTAPRGKCGLYVGAVLRATGGA